jgi:signal transduction histidine kinase
MADSTNAGSDTEAVVRFARRVSHDINNFSTVVRTYSELLLSDIDSSDPMHADIEEIHRAADATVVYVQRVTLFSRARNRLVGRWAALSR